GRHHRRRHRDSEAAGNAPAASEQQDTGKQVHDQEADRREELPRVPLRLGDLVDDRDARHGGDDRAEEPEQVRQVELRPRPGPARIEFPPMAIFDRAIVRLLPAVPRPVVQKLSERYIAGPELKDARETVRRLNAAAKLATIDVLGEEIRNEDEAAAIVRAYQDVFA